MDDLRRVVPRLQARSDAPAPGPTATTAAAQESRGFAH